MTLKDFNLLNDYDRTATVFTDGRLVDFQRNENEYILYYAINSFFTELVYDCQMQEIVEVRSSNILDALN